MGLCGLKKVQDARLCLLQGRNGDFNGIKAFKYRFISVLATLKVRNVVIVSVAHALVIGAYIS